MKNLAFFVAGIALVSATTACDDSSGTGGAGGASSSTTSSSSTKSSGSTTTTTSTATSSSSGGGADGKVRVVHLSPGAPAVDFCVTPAGGAPIGPVLKGLGKPAGLSYPGATPYVDLPVGTYSARVVAPNAADCSTALANLPDIPGIQVAADGIYTVAATGVLAPTGQQQAFAVKLYTDDHTVAAGKNSLRFIHTSPGTPAVDVGTGSGANFTAVWTNVVYGDVGKVANEDYVSVDPLNNATLSARANGTTADALVINGVTVPADQVVTVFAIGLLGSATTPLKALACLDLSAAGTCLELPAP